MKILLGVFAITVCTLGIYSCLKDDILKENLSIETQTRTSVVNHNFIKGDGGVRPESDYRPDEDQPVKTVLGVIRNNPYSVENMTAAWNILYKENLSTLPKTHTYIKFSPASDDDLEKLRQYTMDEKIALFDFPLENEVVLMGDYYTDPSASTPELTYQYAVVPVGRVFPNVNYSVVSDLVIAPYLSYLTYTSFMMTGNVYAQTRGGDGNGGGGSGSSSGTGNWVYTIPNNTTVPTIPGTNFPPQNGCMPSCPSFPCCFLPWYDCNTTCGGDPIKPNCRPGSPFWPNCLSLYDEVYPNIVSDPDDEPDLDDEDPNSSPPSDPYYCECVYYLYSNEQNRWIVESVDGDCSQFEEDGWNTTSSVECTGYTPPPPTTPNLTINGCGCQVYTNQRKPGGCINVLNTNTTELTGVRRVAVHMKDNWFTTDVTFTDAGGCWKINQEYHGRAWMWVKFYNGAATIRALRLADPLDLFLGVRDYVGMLSGPRFNNINVEYLGSNNGRSADQLFWVAATTHNAVQDYLSNPDGIPVWSDLNIILSPAESNTGGAPMLHKGFSAMTTFADLLMAWALGPLAPVAIVLAHNVFYPDITYGYRGLGGTTTGRTYNIIYHEMAHASHHQLVGEPAWDLLRFHIVVNSIAGNDTYGSPGNFAPGSNPQFTAVAEGWAHHYGDVLAENPDLERRNFRDGFIPWGLGLDLSDPRRTSDPSGYDDEVCCFTNAQYFSSLAGTLTMQGLRNRYLNVHINSTSNTSAQVNSLFDNYNF